MAGEFTSKNIILTAKENGEKVYCIPYVPVATETFNGLVKPDGTTLAIDSNGTMSVADISASHTHTSSQITDLDTIFNSLVTQLNEAALS